MTERKRIMIKKKPSFVTKEAFILLSLLLSASACSIKAEGTADKPPAPVNPLESVRFDGIWASDCQKNFGFGESSQVSYTFKGHNVRIVSSRFTDLNCSTPKGAPAINEGTFVTSQQMADKSYLLNYNFNAGGGVTYFVSEYAVIENDILYTSFLTTGTGGVNRATPIKKFGK
jgi:hypothetical protein